MGHHSAAYTLETYGHLIDDELGSALQLADLAGSRRVLLAAKSDAANTQFALGLAVPGGPLDLTPRLFTPGFHGDVLTRISDVLVDEPINHPFAPQIIPSITQFELVYRVEASDRRLGYDWLVHVSREGAVGIHWTMGVQHTTCHIAKQRYGRELPVMCASLPGVPAGRGGSRVGGLGRLQR